MLLLTPFASLQAQTAELDPTLPTRAQNGEVAAQIQLGQAYATGKGEPQDGNQAVVWLSKAADQKSVDAYKALGELYRNGAGKHFARDLVQAVAWYRKAAEANDVESQGMLGVFYSYGQGVEQNYIEAYFWLDVAALAAGPKQAQYAANRQMIGQHITADELEAVQGRVAQWKAAHPR